MLNLKFQNLLSITKLIFVFLMITNFSSSQNQKIERLVLQYKSFNSASEKEKADLNIAVVDKFLNEGDYERAVNLNSKIIENSENHDMKYFLSAKAEFLADNNEGSLSFLNNINQKNLDKEHKKELDLYKLLNYNHLFYTDSTCNYLIKLYLEAGKDTIGIKRELNNFIPPKLLNLKKARRKSGILPGAGLWYVGEKKRAFASAFINFASLGYIVYSIYTKYYFTALLTGGSQFARFYEGGKRASVKIGSKKNRKKYLTFVLNLDDYVVNKMRVL